MEPLLNALNPVQQDIVRDTQGQVLTLAGAGAGKTRVLTYRVAYLLANGIKPWQILTMTFTNKAAKEMRERLITIAGDEARDVWMGTFHAICVRVLVRHGDKIGFPGGKFTIVEDRDKNKLLKDCNELCGVDYETDTIANLISNAKNSMVMPADLLQLAKTKQEKDLAHLYQAYEDKKNELFYMDFDDLLLKTVKLFEGSHEVRDQYQNQFLYVHSDECQDQNKTQFTLLNYFSAQHGNLFMVGDDSQSIYKWRGAEIQNMLNFQEYYPACKIYRLEQNYRSTQVIVEASNALIEHNEERLEKTSFTENTQGDLIRLHRADNEDREAFFVTSVIKKHIDVEGRPFSDFAILYRTNKQSRAIESALTQAGMPYQVIGGTSFYDRKEIKDITAYLRIIDNEFDALALDRIINVPRRGIGETTVGKMEAYARECMVPFPKALENLDDIHSISAKTKDKIREFKNMIDHLRAAAQETTVLNLLIAILRETGYRQMLEESGKEEDLQRLENIEELLNVADAWDKDNEEGKHLSDFLVETTLVNDIDELEEGNAVKLMTVHAAKGLEFPIVLGIGLEENIFPHGRSLSDKKDIEEERRLMYVLMTRAEHKLFLSHCTNRYDYGSSKATRNKMSRFIGEIPERFFRRI